MSLLRSFALAALANAASFAAAALLLPYFDIRLGGFVAAVALFTALAVALRRVSATLDDRLARPSAVLGGLAVTAAALVLTDAVVPRRGFEIEGPWTWAIVILVVWAAGVAYGEVDTQAPADVPPVEA
ncbi:phage holin family protein [Aeromicrobium sp. 50.2.37]|uniref:phage holin family protein n=1 Tax=Aeromicrobium sp. 50.2.37 TaxID=2969305 RepID=UPI00214FAC11|nr:phage holin family protein [Aeromicrobium sp. 50.2.37]MCR4512497.1 phage holin family protein [Aeromicrobium sp. 50.2.37]